MNSLGGALLALGRSFHKDCAEPLQQGTSSENLSLCSTEFQRASSLNIEHPATNGSSMDLAMSVSNVRLWWAALYRSKLSRLLGGAKALPMAGAKPKTVDEHPMAAGSCESIAHQSATGGCWAISISMSLFVLWRVRCIL